VLVKIAVVSEKKVIDAAVYAKERALGNGHAVGSETKVVWAAGWVVSQDSPELDVDLRTQLAAKSAFIEREVAE